MLIAIATRTGQLCKFFNFFGKVFWNFPFFWRLITLRVIAAFWVEWHESPDLNFRSVVFKHHIHIEYLYVQHEPKYLRNFGNFSIAKNNQNRIHWIWIFLATFADISVEIPQVWQRQKCWIGFSFQLQLELYSKSHGEH